MGSSIAIFLGVLFLAQFIWDHVCASEKWMTADPWFPTLPGRLEDTKRFWPLGAILLGILAGHRWWS